jgi:hypothetical protein
MIQKRAVISGVRLRYRRNGRRTSSFGVLLMAARLATDS